MSDPDLNAIVERLRQVLQPRRILLFGSRARGDARPDSDLDLLVEIEDGGPDRWTCWKLANAALADRVVAMDLLVYPTSSIARWGRSTGHIIGRALREGRVLYAV